MTSTTERRIEVVPFPTLVELEERILEPLSKTEGDLDALRCKFSNIVGDIPTTYWEPRLAEPPTFENLGNLAVFVKHLEMQLEAMQEDARAISAAWLKLDTLRAEGDVRLDVVKGDD